MSRPLRSPPITRASALLRAGPPACPHRYSTPHSLCCSTPSLSPPVTFPGLRSPYRHTPSHVPCSSRRPGSRRLHTGHHLASKRAPARLFPKFYLYPGFDVVSCFSMLHQRIAFARLPDPRLTAFTPPFPQSLTTTVFSLCSMRRLDVSPRRATPKGHKTFIYYTALLVAIQLLPLTSAARSAPPRARRRAARRRSSVGGRVPALRAAAACALWLVGLV